MKDEWWFASGGAHKGPVKFEFLRGKVLDGSLSASDLVWTEGMSAWTPVSGVPALHQVKRALPPELPPSTAPEPPALSVPAAPWRRFFARLIDLWVIGLPTVFLVAFFLAPAWPGFALWLQQPGADVALGFLVIPLVLVIEAVIFELFGTTIGKGILGIHVTTLASKKLAFDDYLFRQAELYWTGLGTGFPLVSFFTYLRQYRRLKAGMAASYDDRLFKVTAKKIGFLRYVAAVAVVVVLLMVNGILQMMADAEQRRPAVGAVSQSNQSSPSVAVNTGPQPGQVFKDCVDCPEMVVIPAGSFMMGSNEKEDEMPIHYVKIRSFAFGKYEVTQGQWKAVMGNNPSKFSDCGDLCPVETVSWNDAQQFIQRLNQKTGEIYRLPSEAEWEYAARAGSTTRYWWGNIASREYANYGADKCCDGHAEGQDRWVDLAPVGQFPANPFGLHDMHGNVAEWVQDRYNYTYAGAPVDGSAWMTGNAPEKGRISRGGHWSDFPDFLRSSNRDAATKIKDFDGIKIEPIEYSDRDYAAGYSRVGFRLARTLR